MGKKYTLPNDPYRDKPRGTNLGSLAARAVGTDAKGFLRNLLLYEGAEGALPDTMQFWFRPTPVRQSLRTNYERTTVLGMSHEYTSYTSTANVEITFELYEHALLLLKEMKTGLRPRSFAGTAEGSSSDLGTIAKMMEDDRRFLEALFYPGFTSAGVIGVDAPAAMLCLPGLCTLRGRLTACEFTFEDCDLEGRLREWRAAVTFEEAPMGRISMQDHLANGMFRTWGS